MYYVYILQSLKSGQLYKGFTKDLDSRILAHNKNLSRYTKGRGPWNLIYFESFEDKRMALAREKFYKSGVGRKMLKEILKGLNG